MDAVRTHRARHCSLIDNNVAQLQLFLDLIKAKGGGVRVRGDNGSKVAENERVRGCAGFGRGVRVVERGDAGAIGNQCQAGASVRGIAIGTEHCSGDVQKRGIVGQGKSNVGHVGGVIQSERNTETRCRHGNGGVAIGPARNRECPGLE